MMKKLTVYLCAGMMALSLAACGNGDNTGDGQDSSAGNQTQGSGAGSQTGSGAASDSQTGSNAQDSQPGGSTSDSQPGAGDAAGGSAVVGDHNYEEGWTGEMEGIKTAIVDALGDNYFPDMPLLPDMLEMQTGITADMYDDYFAEMPMVSANVDTLFIIRAKDDKVEEVEAALDAYRDAQVGNTMQYPKNIGVVQGSVVECLGNYVCFVQLGGDTMDIMDEGDEAVIRHCQELNEQVIGIIRDNLLSGS